ncbi:MAG: DUF1569 domain-containing protein [Sphingobacteriales bacterium]|nr:MAG: DUF1569 domain-containing protein [Sphingobacteriales bacterium]
MENIFSQTVSNKVINRINSLKPTTPALWGKMSVAQMLAHCNITYEMVYQNKHPKPNFIMGLILKAFVKNIVVNGKPYKQNSQTAPVFIIKNDKDFEVEKIQLIAYINQTQQLGENYFDGKVSLSFGILSKTEWNNMFYKHLDHHLMQFGV